MAASVRAMQDGVRERVAAHRHRAARAVEWTKAREEARPWLHLVLRAWAGAARRGAEGARTVADGDAGVVSGDEWREWRSRESEAARRLRHHDGAIVRLVKFGELIFTPAKRAAARRLALQRGLRAHIRRMEAARRFQAAGRSVLGMVGEARAERTQRDGRVSGATRVATVVSTVLSRLQGGRAGRVPRAIRAPATRRPALCIAAALGPVSFDMLGQYERLGYG